MLFTAAMTYELKCHTYLIVSDRNKGKDTVAVFIYFLYENCCLHKWCEEYVIWYNEPTSEFKKKFMVKFLQILSQKYQHPFSWKYFARV